jgi:hypothetical protein
MRFVRAATPSPESHAVGPSNAKKNIRRSNIHAGAAVQAPVESPRSRLLQRKKQTVDAPNIHAVSVQRHERFSHSMTRKWFLQRKNIRRSNIHAARSGNARVQFSLNPRSRLQRKKKYKIAQYFARSCAAVLAQLDQSPPAKI